MKHNLPDSSYLVKILVLDIRIYYGISIIKWWYLPDMSSLQRSRHTQVGHLLEDVGRCLTVSDSHRFFSGWKKRIYFGTKLKDFILCFMTNIKNIVLKPFSFLDFKWTGYTFFTELLQQTTYTKAILIDGREWFSLAEIMSLSTLFTLLFYTCLSLLF